MENLEDKPNKKVAALLAFLFGGLGVHHFYLKRYNVGIVWLMVCFLLSWTIIVPLALWFGAIIQGVGYLSE